MPEAAKEPVEIAQTYASVKNHTPKDADNRKVITTIQYKFDGKVVTIEAPELDIPTYVESFKELASNGCIITEMHHERLSLEDIFLKLTEGEVKGSESEADAEDEYTPVFTDEQEEEPEDEAEEEEI